MVLTVVGFAVALLSLTLILRMKRIRDERVMEQHSVTAEELHSLLASNQEVLLLDVRQPLDLLAYPEIIPGARWIPPKEALETPTLIPKEKRGSFTAPVRARKPAERFCIELSPCIFPGLSSSKAVWRLGRRRTIQWSHTERSFTSTLQLPRARSSNQPGH